MLTMSLIPDHATPFLFPLRDIWGITPQTLRLWLQMAGGVSIMMYDLGSEFVRFVIHLTRRWNQLLLEDLFLGEKPVYSGVDGLIEWEDDMGIAVWKRRAEIRLYRSHLVIMPDNREIQKIPLGCIEEILIQDQSILFRLDSGDLLRIFRLGGEFERVHDALCKAWDRLLRKTRASLKHLAPDADRSGIARAARLMIGGKAVTRERLQTACPLLWAALEKRMMDSEIGEPFSYLRSLSQEEKIAIGFRGPQNGSRGQANLLWFLIPIFGKNSSSGGNAMALNMTLDMDATGPSSKAITPCSTSRNSTFFFRFIGRDIYRRSPHRDFLGRVFDRFLRDLNHAFMAVDFCVEPITLSERRLSEPPNRKFYYSLRVMPEVRLLRSNFIGFIERQRFSGWRKEVIDLLRFNVEAFDDEQKWNTH